MNSQPGTTAPDAERAFLGSILQVPDLAYMLPLLAQEDFHHERHRLVYRAMVELAQERIEIDHFTLLSRLELIRPDERSQRTAAQVVDAGAGCLAFLTALDVGVVASAKLCEAYADTVKTSAVMRKALALAAGLEASIRTSGIGPGISRIASELGVLAAGATKTKPRQVAEFSREAVALIRGAMEPGGFSGFETRIPEVDTGIVGLCRKTLSVIGGTPGSGKTAFALQMAHLLALQGKRVFVASLEMSGEMLAYRLACARHRIPLAALISGAISNWQMEQIEQDVEEIEKLDILVDDQTSQAEELVARIRSEARDGHAPDLIIMDYLQIGDLGEGRRSYSREDLKNSAICKMFKDLAKEIDAHALILSQLNKDHLGKGAAGKKPSVHQLRDGGGWQEADLAALLYRPWAMTMDPDSSPEEKGETFLLVGKNRIAAPCEIVVHFDGGSQTFSSPPGVIR